MITQKVDRILVWMLNVLTGEREFMEKVLMNVLTGEREFMEKVLMTFSMIVV